MRSFFKAGAQCDCGRPAELVKHGEVMCGRCLELEGRTITGRRRRDDVVRFYMEPLPWPRFSGTGGGVGG